MATDSDATPKRASILDLHRRGGTKSKEELMQHEMVAHVAAMNVEHRRKKKLQMEPQPAPETEPGPDKPLLTAGRGGGRPGRAGRPGRGGGRPGRGGVPRAGRPGRPKSGAPSPERRDAEPGGGEQAPPSTPSSELEDGEEVGAGVGLDPPGNGKWRPTTHDDVKAKQQERLGGAGSPRGGPNYLRRHESTPNGTLRPSGGAGSPPKTKSKEELMRRKWRRTWRR